MSEKLKKCPTGHDFAAVSCELSVSKWKAYVYCTKCGWQGPMCYHEDKETAKTLAVEAWEERRDV